MRQLPHRWPGLPPDGNPDCESWKCAECGYWVSESVPYAKQPGCTVNWRPMTDYDRADALISWIDGKCVDEAPHMEIRDAINRYRENA